MNKKFIMLIVLFLTSFANNSVAHKSPDPIDISCGLTNKEIDSSKIQYVNYAISPTLLKQHFDLEMGLESPPGMFLNFLQVEVKIKTSSGTITKVGSIIIYYFEKGTVQIDQFDTNFPNWNNAIFIEYPDDVSFKESMKNEIISCKILP